MERPKWGVRKSLEDFLLISKPIVLTMLARSALNKAKDAKTAEKEAQTALDEISQAIKSYNTKMTKAQLK